MTPMGGGWCQAERRTAADSATWPSSADPSNTTATVNTEPGRHTSTTTVQSAPYAIWVNPYSPDAAPIACELTLTAPLSANGLAMPAPTMNTTIGAITVATLRMPKRSAAMKQAAPTMAIELATRSANGVLIRPAMRLAVKLPTATPAISSR